MGWENRIMTHSITPGDTAETTPETPDAAYDALGIMTHFFTPGDTAETTAETPVARLYAMPGTVKALKAIRAKLATRPGMSAEAQAGFLPDAVFDATADLDSEDLSKVLKALLARLDAPTVKTKPADPVLLAALQSLTVGHFSIPEAQAALLALVGDTAAMAVAVAELTRKEVTTGRDASGAVRLRAERGTSAAFKARTPATVVDAPAKAEAEVEPVTAEADGVA